MVPPLRKAYDRRGRSEGKLEAWRGGLRPSKGWLGFSEPARFSSSRGGAIPRAMQRREYGPLSERCLVKCSMWATQGPPTYAYSLYSVRGHFACESPLLNFAAHLVIAFSRIFLSLSNCSSFPCLTSKFRSPPAMAFRLSSLILP